MLNPSLRRRFASSRLFAFLSILGPGILAANADNDASGIYGYSPAGSHATPLLRLIFLLVVGVGFSCRAEAFQEPTPSSGNPQKPPPAAAPNLPPRALLPYEIGLQATLIDQQLFKFHSPYEGPLSLRSRNENEKSDTYTLYLGVRLIKGLEAFLNPEMARGNGLSQAIGLAGFTNGDVIRNPTLGQSPIWAAICCAVRFLSAPEKRKSSPARTRLPERNARFIVWS